MMMAINSDSYSISVHNVIIRMTLVSVIKFNKKKKSFLLECEASRILADWSSCARFYIYMFSKTCLIKAAKGRMSEFLKDI